MENNAQPQSAQLQGDVGVNPASVGENQMPVAPVQPVEDHRTILERIAGIFNRGKKEKVQDPSVANQTTPPSTQPQQ